jgi:hypothetical protein
MKTNQEMLARLEVKMDANLKEMGEKSNLGKQK